VITGLHLPKTDEIKLKLVRISDLSIDLYKKPTVDELERRSQNASPPVM
jgi:hypothetical protein